MNCFKEEIKERLDNNEKYRNRLFKRAFLITDHQGLKMDEYPFYGLWSRRQFGAFSAFIQQEEKIYIHCNNGYSIALIGHAWDPYSDCIDESVILSELLSLYLAN